MYIYEFNKWLSLHTTTIYNSFVHETIVSYQNSSRNFPTTTAITNYWVSYVFCEVGFEFLNII
jgi:hypothetical protein